MRTNSRYATKCSSITCRRQDGIICDDDGCDIERGVIACHCEKPHHLPVWHCPVHGEVVVPMD